MPRKKKTTVPKAKATKVAEIVPVEEVAVSVETTVEEKPVETVPVEEITAPVEEIVVAAVEEAPAPEKKKTTRKTSARKTAEKTTAKTSKTAKTDAPAEEKKPAEKKTSTAKKTASVNVFFQSHGSESAELVEKAKELSGVKSPKSVNLYIKPEENKVYYVVDGVSGGFSL